MPNFQDNFGTNQTSNTLAGATTTPINSIPTVDAPYYIALDATNLNGHYEVVYVTSDTATNINHAATTYAHTTSEEVRLVLPASYLTAMQELEEGGMRNGKLSVTVGSNNLTVAIKTQDGGNPSVTEPVFVKIGGILRTITSALTHTINAGQSWFNLGSAELATKEVDLFVYLGWKTSDSSVTINISRIPFANLGSDFTYVAVTQEKHSQGSGGDVAATDTVVNIGRFAATLSAGAGYTWTVPTFTASNLIQRPIYETRCLDGLITTTVATFDDGAGGQPTTRTARYKIIGNRIVMNVRVGGTKAGTGTTVGISSFPFGISASCLAFTAIGSAFHATGNIGGILSRVSSTTDSAIVFTGSVTDNTAMTFGFSAEYEI